MESAGGKRNRREVAIDHLCLTLPEDELPVAFQVKSSIQIIRAADRRMPTEGSSSCDGVHAPLEGEESWVIRRLRACGFEEEECKAALSQAEGCELQEAAYHPTVLVRVLFGVRGEGDG